MANYKIQENVLDKEPVTCIWRVNGKTVETYVNELLQKHGIDGVLGAQLSIEKTGNSQNNHVNIAVFFSAKSDDITGGLKDNGQDIIKQGEIFGIAGFRPSSKLSTVLTPLAKWNKDKQAPDLKLVYKKVQGGVCGIQLNAISVFRAMLNANNRQYAISVLEAFERGGETVMQIAKTTGQGQGNNKSGNPLKNLQKDFFR